MLIRRLLFKPKRASHFESPVNAYKSLVPKVQNQLYVLEETFKTNRDGTKNLYCVVFITTRSDALGYCTPWSVIAESSMFFVKKPFFDSQQAVSPSTGAAWASQGRFRKAEAGRGWHRKRPGGGASAGPWPIRTTDGGIWACTTLGVVCVSACVGNLKAFLQCG